MLVIVIYFCFPETKGRTLEDLALSILLRMAHSGLCMLMYYDSDWGRRKDYEAAGTTRDSKKRGRCKDGVARDILEAV